MFSYILSGLQIFQTDIPQQMIDSAHYWKVINTAQHKMIINTGQHKGVTDTAHQIEIVTMIMEMTTQRMT